MKTQIYYHTNKNMLIPKIRCHELYICNVQNRKIIYGQKKTNKQTIINGNDQMDKLTVLTDQKRINAPLFPRTEWKKKNDESSKTR